MVWKTNISKHQKGPLADQISRRSLHIGNTGGFLQPVQHFLVQIITGAQAKIQQFLFRDLQAGPIGQKYQHAAPLMLRGLNALNPHH